MNLTRRSLMGLAGIGAAAGVAACKREYFGDQPQPTEPPTDEQPPSEPDEQPVEPDVDLQEFEQLALDMDAWSYDEEHDCYYQLAVPYCLTPSSTQYGSVSLFVPGPYFVGTQRGRSYHCEVAPEAQVGDFTPATAPVAMPINSVACAAQECPSTYAHDGLDRYLRAGMVYAYAGFRGRSGGYESTTQEYYPGGAPWPVVDLKAAVRFLRYNASVLPANMERIFAFGQGAGGGLAAVLGAGGNASCFVPYLKELGAATHDAQGAALGDHIAGVAAWCPLASFDVADAAYEWMVGQYASEGARTQGTWTKLLSSDLSLAYGSYVNDLGLTDAEGSPLELDLIEDGTYGGGSYYRGLVDLIAQAAADFLKTTDFPYTELPLEVRTHVFPGNPSLEVGDVTLRSATPEAAPSATEGVRQVEATIYDTVESYVSSLNGAGRWLTYNESRGEADVTGLWSFVEACRPARRDVCAYDLLDRSGLANQLFGTSEASSLHFDPMVEELLEREHDRYAEAGDWDEALVAAWRGDLAEVDELDMTVRDRVTMMDPLMLLKGVDLSTGAEEDIQADSAATEGVQALPTVAPHWRINTGLFQAETTLAGEFNLAHAVAAHPDVRDMAFTPVWGAGFQLAERSGEAEGNLVTWVCTCCLSEQVVEEG